MAIKLGQGNFINGLFINEGSITLTSKNPSCDYEPVFSVKTDSNHVPLAIDAAKKAYKSWTYQTDDFRIKALQSLSHAFQQHETAMAQAISLEMGKIHSEALLEAKGLSARIDLIIEHGLKRVATESFYDLRAETRYHSQGVLAVIGPYNFPAHLVNAHVIPSILLGNTVVIKPSDICPMVAEIYAQCVKQSDLPSGVVNVIHGDGQIGRDLCANKDIDGVLFTGSYPTGRALKELLLDQPHKILALEMGGKNFAIVMDDADIKQAVLEIVLGAYLTTGQRCTATSRVLVHDQVFDQFKAALLKIVSALRPCKSSEHGLFGPLATKTALDRFFKGLSKAKAEGAEVLLDSECLPGGAFVTPSIYQVEKHHPVNFYLGEELFGPHLCLENFSNLDDALMRVNESPYGLSNSIFTLDRKNSDRMFKETKSGVLNINRSTNNAFGQMPFGGVNKSGNQRPAGIDAVRYATFPVAITALPYGQSQGALSLQTQLNDLSWNETSLLIVKMRHAIEASFATYGIFSDGAALDRICYSRSSFSALDHQENDFFLDLSRTLIGIDIDDKFITINLSRIDLSDEVAIIKSLDAILMKYASGLGLTLKKHRPLAIHVPRNLAIPRSRAMLDRLYKGHFVPQEKKTLVADLERSRGAFLASIDDEPLVLFDAASQIATLGAGFQADVFQNAYDAQELDVAILGNCDLSEENNDDRSLPYIDGMAAKKAFELFLHEKSSGRFTSVAYGASGAEANEIAFDLARQNGPGGTRIIAFEGSFHGRTIMALQATYNKEKRGPFAFKGYEATFLPFPELKNPNAQPEIPSQFVRELSQGKIPKSSDVDPLLTEELKILGQLKDEVAIGNICAVIIEPMQCEGGDKYASNRFFSLLRALTRALQIPLIFDEVQTGFNLGREFFWHQQLKLVDQHGHRELPDCVTLAKKAQLGVCLSIWPNPRTYSPHVIQLKRGLLHGRAIDHHKALVLEKKAEKELKRLQEYFPQLVTDVRACGFAFAFDMPTKELATELIDQRFFHGFMAYIAGEKTLRFRLNMVSSDQLINQLFEKLFLALIDLRDRQLTDKITLKPKTGTAVKTSAKNLRILELNADNFSQYQSDMQNIEDATYEKGRRDSMEALHKWLGYKDSIGIIITCELDGGDAVVGYAIGGPLEHSQADGPADDPNFQKYNTFYSANITVDERVRGLGLGSLLKNEQIKRAVAKKNPDQSPRYLFISSRNRIDLASAMTQINDSLGAYLVKIYDNQYGEKGAKAAYYRLPIAKSEHPVKAIEKSGMLDCRNSLQTPFANIPDSLLSALKQNQLRAMVGSKLTLSNWATPNMVRYSELLRAVMPRHLKHAYFTSGRDEVLDKGLRSLRFHRLDADIAIGFSHQWLGNITAAARSLSHDEGQAKPFSFFKWPKIIHPALASNLASLNDLKETIASHSSNKILGIVLELVGENSALTFNEAFLTELDIIRKSTGIPLVFVENASSLGRASKHCFLSDSLTVKPNMVLWYAGGQLGHVFVDDQYFVDKPLTLISTWDGDEISMARAYHYLLQASLGKWQETIADFDFAMKALDSKIERVGQGVWHALRFKDAKRLSKAIETGRNHGVLFGQGFDNSLMICPKPDSNREQFLRVVDVVNQLI